MFEKSVQLDNSLVIMFSNSLNRFLNCAKLVQSRKICLLTMLTSSEPKNQFWTVCFVSVFEITILFSIFLTTSVQKQQMVYQATKSLWIGLNLNTVHICS